MGETKLVLTADSAETERKLRSVIESQERFVRKAEADSARLRNAAQSTGKAQEAANEQGFGAAALGTLTRYAASAISLTAVLEGVRRTLASITAEGERAAKTASEVIRGIGPGILKAPDSATARLLLGRTKSLMEQGVPEGEAAKLASRLQGAGELKESRMYGELYGKVEDLGQFAEAISVMKRQGGVASSEKAADILIRGGMLGRTDPGILGTAVTRQGPQARAAGLGARDLLTATALLSEETKSPDVAASQVTDLAAAFQKRRISGSLAEQIETVASRGMQGRQLERFLGGEGAARAFGALAPQMERFREGRREIDFSSDWRNERELAFYRGMDVPGGISERKAREAEGRLAVNEMEAAGERGLRRRQETADLQTSSSRDSLVRALGRGRASLYEATGLAGPSGPVEVKIVGGSAPLEVKTDRPTLTRGPGDDI